MPEITLELVLYWVVSVFIAGVFINIFSTILHRKLDSFIPKIFSKFRANDDKHWDLRIDKVILLINSEKQQIWYQLYKIEYLQRAAVSIGAFFIFLLLALPQIPVESKHLSLFTGLLLLVDTFFAFRAIYWWLRALEIGDIIEAAQEYEKTGTITLLFSERRLARFQEKLNAEAEPNPDHDEHPETQSIKPEQNPLSSGSAVKQSVNKEHNSEI